MTAHIAHATDEHTKTNRQTEVQHHRMSPLYLCSLTTNIDHLTVTYTISEHGIDKRLGYQYSGRWRIDYKLCCIMHSVHTGRCPAYLKNTVQLAAARQSRSDLRSSTTSVYLLPPLKTKFGERAFSHAGPSAWNALLTHTHPRRS